MASSRRRVKNIGILFRTLKFNKHPFSKKRIGRAYEVLSKIGKNKRFFISTFSNFSKGRLKKAYVFDRTWKIVKNQKIDLVLDRMRSSRKTHRQKKKISKKIKIINDIKFSRICWDKLKTYKLFPEFVPKTAKKLSRLKSKKIILKKRFGIMGKDIGLTYRKRAKKLKKGMIAQEFIDTSSGIPKLRIKRVHDLRVILINGKIDHFYARIAKKGSLTSNCTKGGRKKFIKKLPSELIEIIKKIDSKFSKYKPRIYAVDFVYDKNQKPWVVELESVPGFAYYQGKERMRNKFLRNIISILK
ncbi:hypothetical protein KY317_00105 [Candidatus Woesearchaeota archaeon]|nr:hypothetical protein [Candidatus Woesearchaeota archaeon]